MDQTYSHRALLPPPTQKTGVDRLQFSEQSFIVAWLPLMSDHHSFALALAAQTKEPEQQTRQVDHHVYVARRSGPIMTQVSDKQLGDVGGQPDSVSHQVNQCITPQRHGEVD